MTEETKIDKRFTADGRVNVEEIGVWSSVLEQASVELNSDLDQYRLEAFSMDLVKSEGVEYYEWEARGKILD